MDRIKAVIDKQTKYAVFPMVCADHCAWLSGTDFEAAATDAEKLTETMLYAYKQYDYDAILLFCDAYIEAQAMGCPVKLSPIPIITGPMGGDKIDRTPVMIEAAKMLKAEVDVPVFVSVKGPFSLAAFLYGLKEFMIALLKDPDKTRSFMNLALDFQLHYLDKLSGLGVNIMIGDPVASASVVSPDIFCQHALPLLKEMITKIKSFGGLTALHICGDTHPIIKHIDQSGVDLLSIEDISVPTSTTKMGGVSTSTMLYGSPINIETDIQKAFSNEYLILSTSCDVPIESPPENVKSMVKSVRDKTAYK